MSHQTRARGGRNIWRCRCAPKIRLLSIYIDIVLPCDRRHQTQQRIHHFFGRLLRIKIPHQRNTHCIRIISLSMSTNNSRTSRSSLIDISKLIYQKIISHISPSSRNRMKLINIAHATHHITLCLKQIIICGVMHNYFFLLVLVRLRPNEIVPIDRCLNKIYILLLRKIFTQVLVFLSDTFFVSFSRSKFPSSIDTSTSKPLFVSHGLCLPSTPATTIQVSQ